MYQECLVLLRFQSDHELNTDDVRTFLRGQYTPRSLAEWCIGPMEDATGQPWTARHEGFRTQAKVFEAVLAATANGRPC